MRKFIAATMLFTAFQAIAGGAPTTADVRRAVTAGYADCPKLKVENVRLVNGREINEKLHVVDVTFDVRMIPLTPSQVQQQRQIDAEYEAEMKVLDDRTAFIKARYKELETQLRELSRQAHSQVQAEGLKSSDPGYQDRMNQVRAEIGMTEVKDQMNVIDRELYPPAEDQPSPRMRLMQKHASSKVDWGSTNCLMISGVNFTNTRAIKEATENGFVKHNRVSVRMAKTYNGWVPTR